MNEDLRQALILAVLGFVIMIMASFGVMRVMSVETACTIVIVLGAILVVMALVFVSYPKAMEIFRRKDSECSQTESADEPKE